MIVSGIGLRVYERAINESSLSSIYTGMWVIGVTVTSVGYGDIAPLTHMGRIICIISALIGVFLTSYVVLAVENLTTLNDENEEFLYSAMRSRVVVRRKVRPQARILLQRFWRLYRKRKMKEPRRKEVQRFFDYLRRFKLNRMVHEQDTDNTLEKTISKMETRLGYINKGVIAKLKPIAEYKLLANSFE